MTTELVFVLDKSGSMYPLTTDVVNGFNAMLTHQKNATLLDNVLLTTVLFNTKNTMYHDRVPLKDAEPLAEAKADGHDGYRCCGCTALIDAVGNTIKHVKNVHKYIRPEDIPDRTLFIIYTDGCDNCSSLFTHDEIVKLISEQKNKGWDILFLDGNENVSMGEFLGFNSDYVAPIFVDPLGISTMFETISDAITRVRLGDHLDSKWKAKIEENTANPIRNPEDERNKERMHNAIKDFENYIMSCRYFNLNTIDNNIYDEFANTFWDCLKHHYGHDHECLR